jgi:hypothetical protein
VLELPFGEVFVRDSYEIAALYADLGDKEHAFEWVNTAARNTTAGCSLWTDFVFDSLRSDLRYTELVRKIGLPQ